jgi:hypothetical protein
MNKFRKSIAIFEAGQKTNLEVVIGTYGTEYLQKWLRGREPNDNLTRELAQYENKTSYNKNTIKKKYSAEVERIVDFNINSRMDSFSEGVFGKSQKEKNSQRAVLNILHRIDGMVGDAKRGKMTEEQLGKIMIAMHKDIVDARIMIRQFNESKNSGNRYEVMIKDLDNDTKWRTGLSTNDLAWAKREYRLSAFHRPDGTKLIDNKLNKIILGESTLSEADAGPIFTRAEAAQIEKIAKKNHAGDVDKSHPSMFEISVDGYIYEINKDGYRKEPDKAFFTVTVTGYDSGRTTDLYRGTDFNKAIKALDKALYL